jgi:hypothetical protein
MSPPTISKAQVTSKPLFDFVDFEFDGVKRYLISFYQQVFFSHFEGLFRGISDNSFLDEVMNGVVEGLLPNTLAVESMHDFNDPLLAFVESVVCPTIKQPMVVLHVHSIGLLR